MGDLIERKDALAKLIALRKDNAEYSCENDIMRGKDIAYENAMDIIARMPAVNRWIPCSERLPEVGIPVLIYDKHHKAFFVAKLDEDYFGFSSNMWHHPADVLFWMPLPEPPKEVEKR